MGAKKAAEIAESVVNRLFSDQIDRTGHSAKRIAADGKKTGDYEAIARDMNESSRRNNPDSPATFTADDARVVARFFDANRSRPVYTKAQSKARNKSAAPATTPSGAGAPDGFQPT
ncbi:MULTISPECIES: hypothetical protein [Burkholderia]|uniref:hypothetical protein n=1 Tax=Burkholderia TaxID=32008 RepID=UPI000F5E1E65|nr:MULTISPECIES: hypothetical protein [Burkholderia]MBY4867290.1 hypothetical protein [Burkholderia anthina]